MFPIFKVQLESTCIMQTYIITYATFPPHVVEGNCDFLTTKE